MAMVWSGDSLLVALPCGRRSIGLPGLPRPWEGLTPMPTEVPSNSTTTSVFASSPAFSLRSMGILSWPENPDEGAYPVQGNWTWPAEAITKFCKKLV